MHYDIVPARIEDCAVISELIHALAQFEKLADQCEATPEKIRLALFGAAPAAHTRYRFPAPCRKKSV